MENIKQSENNKMQLPALDPNKTRLGGSGGLAVVSGIAGGVAKGAFNLIKSILKRSTKKVPIIGQSGQTATVLKSSGTKQVSYANPRISMTQAQRDAAGY